VLSVLPENDLVEFNRKYPKPQLSFSNMGIRAYYHCHTSSSRPEAEHGHFHIFLRADASTDVSSEKIQWSHLVGLSMDNLGQPLQWFTVNHWVTGETWSNTNLLENKLDALLDKKAKELKLVEEWLLAMLGFYKKALKETLTKRDLQIKTFTQGQEIDKTLQDRSIYLLSHQEINLFNDLKSYTDLTSMSHYNT
jgi:hypothetical protein